MMPRYIDANAAIKSFKDLHIEGNCYTPAFIVEFFEKQPTTDVREVRHGHWIGKPISGYADCICSVCGAICNVHASAGIPTQRYCYRCGTKMDLEEKEQR